MSNAIGEMAGTLRAIGRARPSHRSGGARPRSRGLRPTSAAREAEALGRLTEREKEVLELTARGLRSAEIVGELDISLETVDACRARVMKKLQITHRSQLVRFAHRAGLRPATGEQLDHTK